MSSCKVDVERRRSADVPSIDERQFQTIDEVQNMIRQLRIVEQDMKKRRGSSENDSNALTKISENSTGVMKESANIFIQLENIDYDSIPSMPEDTWLFECASTGEEDNVILNIFDDSYLDTGLRNVRYVLLNSVKAAINEERTASTLACSTRLKRNLSYVIRRDSELSSPGSPSHTYPHILTPPSFSHNSSITSEIASASGFVVTTPYLGTDLNNTTVVTHHISPARNSMSTGTRPQNLNATMTRDSPKVLGYNPHLNSNSSGPNSPELNTTFTRSHQSQEEILSTSSNSNNSVYNISMEEIHTMARIQEQSLATSTPHHTLTRKETRVLDYVANGETLPSPNRTWSTDTYCIDQSNPPSDQSSGVSSPRDSQSCENVQIAGDSVRRSMPNLAIVKEVNSINKQSVLQVAPSMSQLRRQPHYISDSRLARPQSRVLSRPAVATFANHQINTVAPPRNQFQTNKTQTERPYTANYQATYTRGKTFQKSGSPVLSIDPDQETRPQNSIGKPQGHIVNSGRGIYQAQAFQSRDGGGRSMPRYSTNFNREKGSTMSQLQPAHPGLNTTVVLNSDCRGASAKMFAPPTAAAAIQNFVSGSSRPSQLPSRLASRIPAPGMSRANVIQQNRTMNYRE